MRIALVLARHPEDLVQYPPLGLGYLAAALRRRFSDLEFIYTDDAERAARLDADLAFISAASANYGIAIRIAGLLKKRRTPVVVGGVHISTLPESLHPVFEAGVVGEGEETAADLVGAFLEKGVLDGKRLTGIRGLVLHGPDGPVLTPPRPLIEDLDRVPHPDRALLGYRGEPAHLLTSRGCPYRCAFCSSSAHWGRYRTFSIPYVIEEIDVLVREFGTTQIHLYDDLFVANKDRLRAFHDLYKARGYHRTLVASCAVRANLVDAETAGLLAAMGFSRVTFGAESASPRVLAALKASVTPEDNRRAVDLCHAAGLRVGLSFVVGSPGEDIDDLLITYLFIFQAIYEGKIDQADVNVLVPYPGTPMWDVAQAAGVVSPGMDWERLRTPWRDLLLSSSLREHGLRAVLYDLMVRRMLRRWETPVVLLVRGTDAADELRALRRKTNLWNRAIVFEPGRQGVEMASSDGWWPIARAGEEGLRHAVREIVTGSPLAPIFLLADGVDAVAGRLGGVRDLVWTHYDERNDLTAGDGLPGLMAASAGMLDVLLEDGWLEGEGCSTAPADRPGFRVGRLAAAPECFRFDRDPLDDPLPAARVFAEVVDLYARLHAERSLFAGLQAQKERERLVLVRRVEELERAAPGRESLLRRLFGPRPQGGG